MVWSSVALKSTLMKGNDRNNLRTLRIFSLFENSPDLFPNQACLSVISSATSDQEMIGTRSIKRQNGFQWGIIWPWALTECYARYGFRFANAWPRPTWPTLPTRAAKLFFCDIGGETAPISFADRRAALPISGQLVLSMNIHEIGNMMLFLLSRSNQCKIWFVISRRMKSGGMRRAAFWTWPWRRRQTVWLHPLPFSRCQAVQVCKPKGLQEKRPEKERRKNCRTAPRGVCVSNGNDLISPDTDSVCVAREEKSYLLIQS
jgi:hypothetical protein